MVDDWCSGNRSFDDWLSKVSFPRSVPIGYYIFQKYDSNTTWIRSNVIRHVADKGYMPYVYYFDHERKGLIIC